MIRQKNKIRVVIVGGYLPKKKMCEYIGNQIILEKETRKNGAEKKITFDNSCLVPYLSGFPPFRSVKHQVFLKEGATECVSWAEPETADTPSAKLRDVKNFMRANIIFRAGNPQTEKKTIIYLMLGIIIILNIIGILAATGNIRV